MKLKITIGRRTDGLIQCMVFLKCLDKKIAYSAITYLDTPTEAQISYIKERISSYAILINQKPHIYSW